MGLAWDKLRVVVGAGGRVRCEPGWRLAPAWSRRLRDFDLWLVWAGRGVMRLSDGRKQVLRPGVCFWMRPGGQYVAEQDPTNRLGVTFLHFDLLPRTGKAGSKGRPRALPAEVHEVADVAYVDAVLSRAMELTRQAGGEAGVVPEAGAAAHLLQGLLMDLEAAADRPGDAGTPRHHRELVMKIASCIRESPREAASVAELARQAGYSPDHFTRVFKQVLGQSPRDFLVHARIGRARQLLRESSLTVTQIADVLGYPSVYFFSRQFKQKTGRSPTQYRHHKQLQEQVE